MEQLKNIINTYQDIIKSAEQKLGKAKQQIYRIGTLRLILFVAGIAGVIHFWDNGWIVITGVVALTFVPFLFLVKLHKDCLDNLSFVSDDWSEFEQLAFRKYPKILFLRSYQSQSYLKSF